eukprot:TRINITY_DN21172_c1_g2_i2.p1 TRINITY_DN21172_c1_g2~~TRINITY_DN21172_c1_g2_i2.p1  ORF type:complete len:425 (+),score=62.36 TRINITY_DN21172_c1_g2_i2:186-1277(+)
MQSIVKREFGVNEGDGIELSYNDGQDRLVIYSARAWDTTKMWYWEDHEESSLRVFVKRKPPAHLTSAATLPHRPTPAIYTPPETPVKYHAPIKPTKWQKGKLLGKGSFASVYEGLTSTGRMVAVKVIDLGAEGACQEDVDALTRELDLMQTLRHTNIIKLEGFHTTPTSMHIFMELAPGGSLSSLIKRFGALQESTIVQYTAQILSALMYLHSKGVVHRDIKGGNILLGAEGEVKVADFGCSKKIDVCVSSSFGCKTMVGTPYWMAPEVISHTDDTIGYGMKADVWSVGCTVIEMYGNQPWQQFDSLWSAVYHIANSTGPPPGMPTECHPLIKQLLLKAFERDVALRASAAELHALAKCIHLD